MNYRARLAKLEKVTHESFRTMSDEELAAEIDESLNHARSVVCYHLNRPDGLICDPIGQNAESDVTLQMIADSEHVNDIEKQIARLLIETGCRKMASEATMDRT